MTSATPYGAPTAPRDFQVLGNDRSLAVSWAAPSADGGSPVTGYRLAWSKADASDSSGSRDLAATARAHTIPNLSNDSAYTVTLTASNAYYAGAAASGGDTPFKDSAPSFGAATVPAQTRTLTQGDLSLTLPAATGGNFDLTYSLTPSVNGLTFDPKTRVLSGTGPVGSTQMTYRVDDGDRFDTDADADTLTFTYTVSANSAPTAAAIAKTAYEDIPLAFAKSDFTGAFSDADAGDSLSIAIIFQPQAYQGRLTLGGTAVIGARVVTKLEDLDTLVFTPAAGYTGTATFRFNLIDQPGATARSTATITVHANDPPLAAAGTAPHREVAGGRTVTLTNTSRDTDGDTMTWLWEQIAGTSTVTLSDATAQSPTFTAPDRVDGLAFRLTATDEHGATATDSVWLNVYTPPGAPATLTTTPGDGEVTLSWTPGPANGHPIRSWQYRASADGGTNWGPWQRAGRGRPLEYFAVVPGLRNGTDYTFAVRAGNAAGHGAARTATGTPQADPVSNRYRPTVRAGADQTVQPGATVTLDASRSYDWDYVIKFYLVIGPTIEYDDEQEAEDFTYRWTQVRTSTATPLVTLSDPTALKPTFTAPDKPTHLVFHLKVNDGVYDSLDDPIHGHHEVGISVVWPEGTPSFGPKTRRVSLGLRPGDTLTRVLPEATGGTAPLTYSLTPAAPGVMSFDAATRTVTLTPTAVGTLSFDYTVTDADQDRADSDSDTIPLSVRVAAVSTPPTFGDVSIGDVRFVKGQWVTGHADNPSPLPRGSGGEGPLTYSLTPAVPGLTFDPLTRQLKGSPSVVGSYAMTYKAVDADADRSAADSATLSFTIKVVENSPLVALFPGQTVKLRMKIPMAKWRHTERSLNRYPYAVNFADYFHDPDGRDGFRVDGLRYPPIVSSICADDTSSCGYVNRTGTWTFDVTAEERVGGTRVTQRFHVTGLPANRAPVAVARSVLPRSHTYDARDGLSVGRYGTTGGCGVRCHHRVHEFFSDPDGDPLVYRAVSSDPRMTARIEMGINAGNYWWISEAAVAFLDLRWGSQRASDGDWSATVTVSATDPEGESVYIDIPVTVRNQVYSGPAPTTPAVGPPSFGEATVANRSWPANKAIIPLTLPAATGGTTPLTYTLTPAVPGLTFDAATRTLSGTPTTVAAARTMTYQVSDSAAPARTATLSFTITITNTVVGKNKPTSSATVQRLPEDTPHTFAAGQFPFSDDDADEYLHKLQVEKLPGKGTLRLNGVEQAAGVTIARADLSALTYHPPANWYGRTSFTFKVVDTTARASAAAYHAYLVVEPVNDAPTSADFERTVAEDTALTLAATDFPFADVDGHLDALGAVVIASLPAAAAGTLTLDGTAVTAGQSIATLEDADGKLSFDDDLQFAPAANWNGAATFRFGVTDSPGLSSDSYTATIRVTPVNDAPATADLTRSVNEDTTLQFALADFTFDDVDAGDRLKAIVFKQAPQSGDPAQAAGTLASFHGSVESVIDGDDTVAVAGLTRLEYRPDADFSGEVTFTFQVTDQADAVSEVATGTVQVAAVNDAPTSEAFTVSGNEDVTVTVAAASFVFQDADTGDSLKAVEVVTVPDAAHGVLALKGNAVEADDVIAAADLGSVTFAPVADWFGNAQFTFRVVDQADERSAAAYAATIAVAAGNDAPTAADFTRKWSSSLDFGAAFESVFADVDPDDRLRAVVLAKKPTGGGLWIDDTEQAADAVIETAKLSDLEFRPSAGVYRASISYRVQDLAKEASAQSYTLSLWWNTPPAAKALARSTREDSPLPLAPADFDGVFTDADDGDRLTAVIVATLPAAAQGALTLDGAAVAAGQAIARARLVGLVFTPAADWNGNATFGFRLRDREGADSAAATATVTVTAVADAPVAAALNVSTAEDTARAFTAADFEGVFSDADGDALKAVRVVTLPAATAGALALDGEAVSANDLVEYDDLGDLTFTPVANWHGQASFTFKVVDQTDTESAAATAQVTVTAVADTPAAGALAVSTAEDTVLAFTAEHFKNVFSDADGDGLKAVKVASLPDAGHGALALAEARAPEVSDPKAGEEDTGRGAESTKPVTVNAVIALDRLGSLRFTPAQDWSGDASFTFRVVDGTDAESAAATATITVTGAGDAPAASALSVSTAEDVALTITAADFDTAFSDPDPDDGLAAVRVVSLPAAAHGVLALDGTAVTADQKIVRADLANLVFTPVANWSGDASFTFKVVDGSDTESGTAATATVTVTAVADAPAAAALKKSTPEDTALTFAAADFTAVFSDVDSGDSLKSVQVVSLPDAAHGALAYGGAREAGPVTVDQVIAQADLAKLTFTPAANYVGEATFDFRVLDQGDLASAAATATVTVTAAADPPAAAALSKSTAEETALTFAASDFEEVFTDPDAGDSLKSVKVVSLPDAAHGALALDGTAVTADKVIAHADLGDLTFTPVVNWNGDARFTFKVADQAGAESAAATATVTVTAVNDPPVAGALAKSTDEDTALALAAADFDGVFTDLDPGDSLKSVKVVSLPDAGHGALALDGVAVTAGQVIARDDLGYLAFTPAAHWHGEASFTFKVADQADAESAAATATITVTSVADAPVAAALGVSTAEETALAFTAADFEGVFSDGDDGDSLKSVKVVSLPGAGRGALALDGVAVTANKVIAHADLGDLTFTPVVNWNGEASFTFKVADQAGAESAAATATVTVTGVADPPAATALGLSTAEDTALAFTAANFDEVFKDPDPGDSLKSVKVVTLPASTAGALALDGSAVTANRVIARDDLGDLAFTPAANWTGEASFTFKVADQLDAESAAAATATITVTAAADAPVARTLNLSTAEDTALAFTAANFDGVFSDPDAGDSLKSVKVVTLPASTGGALTLDGTAVTADQVIARADLGDLAFTPVANWNGAAGFTFKVTDQAGAESAAATATITVTAVADAPAAAPLTKSMAEDTALTFAVSDFTGVFTDPDAGDSLKAVKVVTLPALAQGDLTLSGADVSANQEVVSANQVIARSELGTLRFKPQDDVAGDIAFTFQVLDQSATASATADAIITVTPVADPPMAAAVSASTAEDTVLTFTAAQFDAAFTDPDAGDSLKAVKVVSLPAAAHGALALDGSAATAGRKIERGDLGSLTFTPAANWNGKASFTFKVVDQTDAESRAATATVTVGAVNDAPVAAALSKRAKEDTPLPLTGDHFAEVFSDPDAGDRLTKVKIVTLPEAEKGSLALGDSAVTVNQVIDEKRLEYLRFTPAANFAGEAGFTFQVVDRSGAASTTAGATIPVTAEDDAPVAAALSKSTAEDTALTFAASDFEAVFSDPDAGDTLAAVLIVSLPAAAHGVLALNGTAVQVHDLIEHRDLGRLTFTPAENWHGEATFDFTVVDQTDADSVAATATVTVTAVADAPVAEPLSKTTAEDTALTLAASDFEGVFTDPDPGDSLKVVKVTSLPDAAQGALALDGTAVTANQEIAKADLGTLVFTPAANFTGKPAFGFQVSDASDRFSATTMATVRVVASNDAPAAGALGVSTAEDTALTFTAAQFGGVFTDPDAGDSLKAVKVTSLPDAAHGALALSGSAVTANRKIAKADLGSLTFTPVGDWNGAATFAFKVVDQSDAESAAATATVTVTAVADAPAAGALGVSTAEDTALTFTAAQFDGVFNDPDSGDSLKAVKVVTLPASTAGALALGDSAVTANDVIARSSLGTLKFTPVANFTGKATFTFQVRDRSDRFSATATATVTVGSTNDAPAAGALAVSTSEDTALTFTAAQFDGVFTDADSGDSLKAVRVVTLPASTAGALALGGSAVTANDVIARGSLGTLKFTPVANYAGQATFTFKVADQSGVESAAATATVTVSAVNDVPAAGTLGVSTSEDTALTFTAAQFDGVFSDADSGDSLKAVKVVTLPKEAAGALTAGDSAVTANQVIARASLGTLKFTPVADYAGKATFTFKVADQSDAESAAATATVTVSAVNDAPVAGALGVSTDEDTVLTFTAAQFVGVFTDADSGDSLKAVKVVTLPAATAGALTLSGSAVTANRNVAKDDLGTLKFTPVGDWNGETSFTFKVVDQSDVESAAATATVTVSAANDAPAAGALAVSTAEDTALTFTAANFTGVFSDPDAGDSLKSVMVATLPAGTAGALKVGGSAVKANEEIAKSDLGTLKFTPVANYAGQATFTFKVVDPSDAVSAAATATVTVSAVADAPAAGALGVSTAEDTVLTFTAANFDGVFTDPDSGDSLKAVKVVTLPAATAGALALNGTAVTANQKVARSALGTLKFTPVANWNGRATFTFKVVDQSDAESAAATATVRVSAVNDAPAASALGVSTAEDTVLTFTAAHFTGVFSDLDAGDSLKAVRVVTLPAAAAGALALNGTAVTAKGKIAKADLATLKFTPVANWNGQATFTFKVVDQSDAESAAATATITVSAANDAPAARALGVSTAEDTALTFTAANFTGVFSDADAGDSLKAVKVVTLPAGTAGTLTAGDSAVTANGKIAKADLGTLKFTPAANWNGRATFTFKVADQSNAESAAATATITVGAANDAPTAGALGVSTTEDTALTFTAANFTAVFSDADAGDSLKSVMVVTLPAGAAGALTAGNSAVTANQVIARASLGTLKFTPVANWSGQATFTFKVADQSDGESAAATATVTVSAVADAPVASALNVSTTEDTALTFTAANFTGVFSDADAGDSLKSVMVVTLPAAAAGVLALNGTAVTAGNKVAKADLGTLKFTPVANYAGKATFTFKVLDQSGTESGAAATATITVNAANDAPAAGALGVSTTEDTALTFTAANFDGVFTDPDSGDSLKSVRVATLPAGTAGALTAGASAVTANQAIARGSLGTLKFTPVANWHGTASFTFKVVDQAGAMSAAATATVTVSAVADAPVASAVTVSTAEDTVLTFTAANFTEAFSDPDSGDSLKSVKVVTLPAAAAGALALNGSAVTANQKIVKTDLGSLKFTPVANYAGKATFTFKVLDQSGTESGAAATATVTVTGANDAPAAGALGVSTTEDTALTFTAANFTGVFSDPDTGDSLKSVKVVTLPAAAGELALSGNAVTANQKIVKADLGSLKFTPVANWNGQATFTFKVVDQSDAESAAAATATVTVTAVADAPAARALTVSTAEDTALTFTAAHFTGAFSDPDSGDSLKSVKVVTLPDAEHGELAVSGTAVTADKKIAKADLGNLTFTPVADWNGKASFTFKVLDQAGTESGAAATATVTVSAVNDAPAAAALAVSTAEDTALTFTAANFTGVFSDPDSGDSLKSVKVVTLPAAAQGTLALSGTAVTANRKIVKADLGSLKFTPAANYAGQASFTFKVVDQSDVESAAAATATVTVGGANDAPTASALNVSTTEDTALTFTAANFTGVFSDPDADDSLKSVKVVTLPDAGHGALALNGTAVTAGKKIVKADLGTLKFTPVANWSGKASFMFKVLDQAGTESGAAATATVTVTAVADAPAAGPLAVSTTEDAALTFTAANFTGVFSDADSGDSLKAVKVVSLPDAGHGALALGGTALGVNQVIAHADLGTLTFTPAADYAGAATFGFQVSDLTDRLSATATATVTVTAVADAPAAGALEVSTAEDTALAFTAANFTGVFSDADSGDSLKAVQVVTLADAGHGVLALSGTAVTANQKIVKANLGKLTFTPVANWNGKASFTFKVVDQADAASAAAKATIEVTAVADAPAAGALEVSTAEDTALTFTAANFTGVFSDPDSGDSLKAVQVVTLPDAGHGALSLVTTVGQDGTAVKAKQEIAHGDLGKLTFTPVADWNGDASFTFKVVDQTDAASAAATATIEVTAVNDAPQGVVPREPEAPEGNTPADPTASVLTVSTAEDTALTFTAANFEGVFSDPDSGDSLKAVQVVSLPDAGHGELALSGSAVTADQKIVKANLGKLTFTPVADWNGDASFTFKLVDQTDAASAAAKATVKVTAVNDAPVAAALNLSTVEDTALTFKAAQFEAVFTDVDDGDSLKAVTIVSLPVTTAGALALRATAVTANDEIAHGDLGRLKFTPVTGFTGSAAFTFKVVDQSAVASAAAATATIKVNEYNEDPIAPGAIPDQTATQGVAFTYTAPDDVFTDPDGDTLVWSAAVRAPASVGVPGGPGGDTPSGPGGDAPPGPDEPGTVRAVTNYRGDLAVFPSGRSFVGDADGGLMLSENDDDNEGGLLDWLEFDGSTHTFKGTPDEADPDGTTIRVTVTDPSGAFAYSEFNPKVLPPVQVSVSGPAQPVAEGGAAAFTVALSRAAHGDVTVRWATADGTGANAAAAGSDYTAQAATDVTIGAGETERIVAVATLDDDEDEDAETFSVQISAPTGGLADGFELGTSSATASIVDAPLAPPSPPASSPPSASNPRSADTPPVTNAPPIAGEIPDQTAIESVPFTYTVPADVFYDPDGDPLVLAASRWDGTALPAWLTFSSATFSGTPGAADVGATPIRVTAIDSAGGLAYAEFTLTVLPRALVRVSGPEPVAEGTPAHFTVSLSRAVADSVTVRWETLEDSGEGAATAGSDYTPQAATELTFAAGQTRHTVTVATLDDPVVEGAKTFSVRLSAASGELPAGVALDNDASRARAVIADDDEATISLVAPDPVREGETATLEIILSQPVARPVIVHCTTVDGTATAAGGDYEAHAAVPMVFAPGVTRQTVQAVTYADYLVEDTETFLLRLDAAPQQALPDRVSLAEPEAEVMIEDNRRPVADAGPDREVDPAAAVTLDGSASYDPDGDEITSYAWTQSAGEPVELAAASSARPRFTAPELPGAMSFELVVRDDHLESLPDEVTITVRDVAPRFLETVPDQRYTEEQEIAPLPLPQAAGGNGGPLTYELTSEPAGLAGLTFDPATRVLSGIPRRTGSLTFTYVAHDADANRELSDAAVLTFVVTVQEAPYRRMLKPVLAAFGRATLLDARSAIGSRFGPAAEPAGTLIVAERQVPFGAPAAVPEAVEWRPAADGDPGGAQGSLPGSVNELLSGSAFELPLLTGPEPAELEIASADSASGKVLRWILWGRGSQQGFRGEPEAEASYQGDLRTAWLGLEANPAGAPWLAGVALSHSLRGSVDYAAAGGDQAGETGHVGVTVTGLYPYAHWQPADGSEISALLGVGNGTAAHERDGAVRESSDLHLLLGAIGLRQALSAPGGWLEVAVRGDAGFARVTTGTGLEALDGLAADAGNVRLGVEAAAHLPLGDGALRPFAEVAARYDGGHDVTGAGVEVAGGLQLALARFELEARGRLLALHSAAGQGEHGVSVTARLLPESGGLGLSLALSPHWGAQAAGSGALWQDALPQLGGGLQPATLEGALGFGIALPGSAAGVLTPFAELGLTEDAGHRLRLGTRLELAPAGGRGGVALELGAERHQTGDAAPEQSVDLDVGLRY